MERTLRVQALFEREHDFFIRLTTNHLNTIAWLREEGLLPVE